jgi:hypothetical protein
MPRSLWRTLMPLVAVLAALLIAACGSENGGSDTSSTGGTPATGTDGGNVTEELFAGTAAENRLREDHDPRVR